MSRACQRETAVRDKRFTSALCLIRMKDSRSNHPLKFSNAPIYFVSLNGFLSSRLPRLKREKFCLQGDSVMHKAKCFPSSSQSTWAKQLDVRSCTLNPRDSQRADGIYTVNLFYVPPKLSSDGVSWSKGKGRGLWFLCRCLFTSIEEHKQPWERCCFYASTRDTFDDF